MKKKMKTFLLNFPFHSFLYPISVSFLVLHHTVTIALMLVGPVILLRFAFV